MDGLAAISLALPALSIGPGMVCPVNTSVYFLIEKMPKI